MIPIYLYDTDISVWYRYRYIWYRYCIKKSVSYRYTDTDIPKIPHTEPIPIHTEFFIQIPGICIIPVIGRTLFCVTKRYLARLAEHEDSDGKTVLFSSVARPRNDNPVHTSPTLHPSPAKNRSDHYSHLHLHGTSTFPGLPTTTGSWRSARGRVDEKNTRVFMIRVL